MSEVFIQGMIAGCLLGSGAAALSTKMMMNRWPWEGENAW